MQNSCYFITKYWTPYTLKSPHPFITEHRTLLVPDTKHGTPYVKKIPHPFITKHRTPLVPVAKHGTPCLKKIPHPFITKHGTPLPVTKHGTPYLKEFHTHSLRNIDLLLPLLLKMELLIQKNSTPIYSETWNSSCSCYWTWNTLSAKMAQLRNE